MRGKRGGSAARWLVIGVGAAFVVVQMWHVLRHRDLSEFLFGGLPPLLLGFGVLISGLLLPRIGIGERGVRVTAWLAVGAVFGVVTAGLWQLHQAVNLGVVAEPYLSVVNAATEGGALGLLIGVYDARRVEREAALEASEDKFRGLVRDIDDGFFILDRGGFVTFANPGLADIVGVGEPAEMEGKRFVEFLSGGDRSCARFRRMLEDGEGRGIVECTVERRGGEEGFVEVDPSPVVEEGEVVEVRGLVRDVTDRRRAEEVERLFLGLTTAVAEAPTLRSALEAVLRQVVTTNGWSYGEAWIPDDEEGVLRPGPTWYVDEGLDGFEGVSRECRFERGEGLPGRVWESGQPEWMRDVSEARNERYLRRDSAREAGLGTALGVPAVTDGEVEAVLVFFQFDPSAVSQRQVDLVSAAARRLGDVVRYRRLEEAREVRDRLEVLNRLVRHDIRNDMQLVTGWGEQLRSCVDGECGEMLEDLLTTGYDVIEITETARDLVDIFVGGHPELHPVDLGEVVRNEVRKARARYGGAEIRVGEVPSVDVEANAMLTSVVRNLVNNAVQHNDKESPEVAVSVVPGRGEVRLRVADNGPGIPDDRKEEVFGRDERGMESDGSGVGLYLVRELAETFGGEAWVEDNDPEGAVFEVRLPKAR